MECAPGCAAAARAASAGCADVLGCVRRVELRPPGEGSRAGGGAGEVPLGELASLTGLRALALPCRRVTGSLDALGGARGLESLRLDVQGLSGGLEGLSGLTLLQELDLSALPPGAPGARDCAAGGGGPPWAREGSPGDGPLEPPALGAGGGLAGDLAPLALLKQLRFLRVEGTEIAGDLSAVASLPGLEELHVGGNCLGGGAGPLGGPVGLAEGNHRGQAPEVHGLQRSIDDFFGICCIA